MRKIVFVIGVVAMVSCALAQQHVHGAIRILGGPRGGAGNVNLPYQVADNSGNTWMIYHQGWLQQQGNQPIYSQGAMLQVNNQGLSQRTNTARMDDKTGEVVFENMTAGNIQVTRRILINKEDNYVRYIEILKNTQGAEQTVNVQLNTNLNYGINGAEIVPDPRRKDQNIAWCAMTGANRAAMEMYAGKGSKLAATINYQQGSNSVQVNYAVPIPANKEVALIHLHGTTDNTDTGVKFVQNFRESKMIATLPPELRRIVVNFPAAQGYIGDREILRGELFDVVEIRGGDQMKGNLKEPSYKLETFYGSVDLPAERIVGMLNIGEYRPRQLLITSDGEIFGGKLSRQTIALELTSGQVTQVPLSQITRLGYRKRSGEPEEWTFEKPFVALRSGDRICVQMPTEALEVSTRYGVLKLDPKSIATVLFQTEEHGVHEVFLADGSRFASLVRGDEFDMKLAGGGSTTRPTPEQSVKFPASAIARIQFTGPPPEGDDPTAPSLALSNEDVLVGSLTGQMRLDTAFDTISINAGEIRKLTRAKDAGLDVQVTLWDSSVLSGQLQDPVLKCALASGITVPVPVSLVQEYSQPQPQPSGGVVDKIKAAVQQLNADDWKERDKAQAELTSMGNAVVSVLKQLRANQPPEAQQRIDQIIAALTEKKKP